MRGIRTVDLITHKIEQKLESVTEKETKLCNSPVGLNRRIHFKRIESQEPEYHILLCIYHLLRLVFFVQEPEYFLYLVHIFSTCIGCKKSLFYDLWILPVDIG